jgi:hypothetical protein
MLSVEEGEVEPLIPQGGQGLLREPEVDDDLVSEPVAIKVLEEERERALDVAHGMVGRMEVDRVDDVRGRRERDRRPTQIRADLQHAATRGELGEAAALRLGDGARDVAGVHEARLSPEPPSGPSAPDELLTRPGHQHS